MIPYFSWTSFNIGPITIYVWGTFVALGALIAFFLAERAARKMGMDRNTVGDIVAWMIVWGFVGARFAHILFYNPLPYLKDPLEIFRVWNGGLSSLGGFIAAFLVLLYFVKRKKMDLFRVTDALVAGFPLGWAVGRIGCFLIHDHPGTLSHSFLAVQYPGGSRFDLGLIESLTGFFLELVLLFVLWKFPKRGIPTYAVCVMYLVIRFCTDFLRATDLPNADVRFAHLTPAQIGAIILFGIFTWVAIRKPGVKKLFIAPYAA